MRVYNDIRNTLRLSLYGYMFNDLWNFITNCFNINIKEPDIKVILTDKSKIKKLFWGNRLKQKYKKKTSEYYSKNRNRMTLGFLAFDRTSKDSKIFILKPFIDDYANNIGIAINIALLKVLIHELIHVIEELLNVQIHKEIDLNGDFWSLLILFRYLCNKS